MRRWLVPILLLVLFTGGCQKEPPDLSPDAKMAFYATRVVKALDVVRDSAIAANDLGKLTTNDTREVVLWHKAAVQVIQVSPQGWRPIVKESAYVATCDARLAPLRSDATVCVPRLPKAALAQLAPYFGLIVLVIQEVQ